MIYNQQSETLQTTSLTLQFGEPKNTHQADALEMLKDMQPDERTAFIQRAYESWYNDQLKALQAVYGD